MDNSFFELFFRDNYTKAYYVAYRLTHEERESEDIVSEAFELVWKNVQASNVSNAYSYLFTTVRNLCTDYLRRKVVRDRYQQMQLILLSESIGAEDKFEDERIAVVMKAIDELPPKTRAIICACFIDHKHYKEVAEAMGISVSAVKKHVVKGLRFLRSRLIDKGSK